MILEFIFRLSIWFLLTADISAANSIIGICIALFLPSHIVRKTPYVGWVSIFTKIFKSIPQAFFEVFDVIIRPHKHEEFSKDVVDLSAQDHIIFLEIFVINFTPKTLVFKYDPRGWYGIHKIVSRKKE